MNIFEVNGEINGFSIGDQSVSYVAKRMTELSTNYPAIFSLRLKIKPEPIIKTKGSYGESILASPRKRVESCFQFNFHLDNLRMIGSFKTKKISDSFLLLKHNSNSTIANARPPNVSSPRNCPDYAQGIRTMRLVDGKIQNALEYHESENEDADDEQGPRKHRKIEDIAMYKIDNKNLIFKRFLGAGKKEFNSSNMNKQFQSAVDHNYMKLQRMISELKQSSISNRLIVFVVISFFAFSLIYLVQDKSMLVLKDQLLLYAEVNRGYCALFSLLCKVHSPLVDMLLFNQGLYVNDLPKNDFEELMKKRLLYASNQLTEEKNSFITSLRGLTNSLDYESFSSNLEVDCYLNKNSKIRSTVMECIHRIQSSILNIYSLKFEEITMQNSDVYMVMMNTVNDLQLYLKKGHERWPENIHNLAVNNRVLGFFKTMQLFLYVYTAGFVAGFYLIISNIIRRHEQVLEVYYSFKKSDIKELIHRCEYFYNNIINQEEEEDQLDEDDIRFLMLKRVDTQLEDEIILPSIGNRKGQLKRHYLFQTLFLVFLSILHQIYIYFSYELVTSMIDSRESVVKLAAELNVADLVFLSPQNKLKRTILNQTDKYWNIESQQAWANYREDEQPNSIRLFKNIYIEKIFCHGLNRCIIMSLRATSVNSLKMNSKRLKKMNPMEY